MELEGIMLNEIRQKKNAKWYNSSMELKKKRVKRIKTVEKWLLGNGGGYRERLAKGHKILALR